MPNNNSKWLTTRYQRITNSIAFLPATITLLFLGFSIAMVLLDFSVYGKQIKSQLYLLSLKDASTARSIISSIVSGIISLAVFSFSLVMIILNQTASQMSNRILDKLIGNKFQQTVLGFYVGTIVFALFLLSTIRDLDSGVSVPALSTYLLIALTVLDLFLFIYFLHYITQSVKYETIIRQIFKQTKDAIERSCTQKIGTIAALVPGIVVNAPSDGHFQTFHKDKLIRLCQEENIVISFLFPSGSYFIKGAPYMMIAGTDSINDELTAQLNLSIIFDQGMTINTNYHYGFRQLMEVAIKALSPGINDPGTAVASLQSIGSLLAIRMNHLPQNHFTDTNGKTRIITKEINVDEIFTLAVMPIWDYGKKDRIMQQAFYDVLTQLQVLNKNKLIDQLLLEVKKAMEER